jgi:type III restriction enzyme
MTQPDLSNPILNSPYDPPESHFEIGPNGPTGKILTGRRPSESFIPVPAPKKGHKIEQQVLDFDVTGERREQNTLINDIRREVERWRTSSWNGVTPYSRKLLAHWAAEPPARDDPVFFCQREAAETAIFLTEVAGRHGTADYRRRLGPGNELHNDGLPRIALKMATGSGKTVVMAMLIAWQTINKVFASRDARFAKQFLVVTPGITIGDRLGVLHPEREDSYYPERDLVPADLWEALNTPARTSRRRAVDRPPVRHSAPATTRRRCVPATAAGSVT